MQFRRPGKPNVGINIAPLVDVVFLLVIFFAVSTTFLETAGLELELPDSTSTTDREPEAITVSLAVDGTLALNGEVLAREDLGDRLRSSLDANDDKTVVLQADTNASHGEVVRVIDLIRDSGAQGLTVDALSSGTH